MENALGAQARWSAVFEVWKQLGNGLGMLLLGRICVVSRHLLSPRDKSLMD